MKKLPISLEEIAELQEASKRAVATRREQDPQPVRKATRRRRKGTRA